MSRASTVFANRTNPLLEEIRKNPLTFVPAKLPEVVSTLKPDSYVTIKPAAAPTGAALAEPVAGALATPESSMPSSDSSSSSDDEFVTPVSSQSSTPAEETEGDSYFSGEAAQGQVGKGLEPIRRRTLSRINKNWGDNIRAPLGLDNRGVTCYMNAAIQAIIHVPAMAHYLRAVHRGEHRDVVSPSSVSHEFAQLFYRLTDNSKRRSLYPGKMIRRLEDINCMMSEWQQEDSHEYFMSLMGRLQEDTVPKGAKLNTSIIHDIFGGNINQKVTCKSCGHVSTTHQDFYDLPVSFSARERRENKKFTLEGSIRDFFSPEILKPDARGKSGYQCEKCKQVTVASKRNMINEAPEYLAVHIKRFKFQGSSSQKLKEPMAYPLDLDLSPYSVHNEQIKYRLISVIVHEGRHVSSGHYVALCRQPNNAWAEYDDESIRTISEKSALRQESAYMLIYSRVDSPAPVKRRASSVGASAAASPAAKIAKTLSKQTASPIAKSADKPVVAAAKQADKLTAKSAVPLASPAASPSLKRPSNAAEDIDRIFSLAKKKKIASQA